MDAPQTADQINVKQVGKLEFPPGSKVVLPDPEKFIASQAGSPIKPKKPEGCWDMGALSGSREGVMRAIQADPNCPQDDKDWLCGKISKLPTQFNHVVLHAYCHVEKGHWTFDMAMTPSIQLM